MRVSNPNKDRAIIATIARVQNDPNSLETFEVPPGESIDVDDYAVAATLVEYGAVAAPEDLRAARVLWAERNRTTNSATASASASEGEIVARRQATVDVATGGTDPGTEGAVLRGADLDAAVKAAKDAGAEIASGLTADEKRDALARWQATQGSSTPPAETGQYVTDPDSGQLYLDDEGQPVEIADVLVDAQGHAVFEDGKPVQKLDDAQGETVAQPTDVTPPPANPAG